MGFQEIATQAKYYKFKEMKPNEVICTGWYVETRRSKFGHMDYFFQDEGGVLHCLNHSGHLEYLMEKAQLEDFCRVTYMGTDRLTKGVFAGKDAHKFKLEIDKTRFGQRSKVGFTEVEEPKDIADEDIPL